MRLARAVLTVTAMFVFTSAAGAKTDTVRMQDFQFVPKVLVINPGDTVVWKSIQFCCDQHTSTRTLASGWDSGPLALNGTFQRAFTEGGSYEYWCTPHQPIGMIGQITVTTSVPSNNWAGLALLLASLTAAALWILERRRKRA
ncbi:MAG: plastocyanin/azurin family copper-binding protein [candidate division Zixibacteria bacterium]|nr:plastocyanin/azurin family copper-binding protein [candidate division Zixibacteria bacterium]